MENKQNKGGGLNKSLKLIFVYTVATGSIFTFVNYWDSVFYGYCGSGTFLAFALMTVAILPVALVYSELASLFHTSGGELIYNTVGINKHVGFLASWLIMAAWISVPPAVVMAIMTWVNKTFALGLGTWQMVGCAAVLLVLYFFMSIQNVQFLVKAQAGMLFCNITVTILTGFILLFSGHWHISNFGNIFQSTLDSVYGIPGWVIGMALLITPYFGFETDQEFQESNLRFHFNLWLHLCVLLFLRSRSGWIKGCVYKLCTGWFLNHCYHAECTGLDILADHCRYPFLPLRYGRFLTGILDVYRPYAVLYGK